MMILENGVRKMNKSSDHNIKRQNVLKWIFIVAVNAIIAITVIVFSVLYAVKQNEERYAEKENNFTTALDAMGQTAYLNLHTEQVFCDNWATYVNSRPAVMKLSEVKKFTENVNSDNERVMVHVVDYESYKAFGTLPPSFQRSVDDNNIIDYNDEKDSLTSVFEESKNCDKSGSHLHISLPFTNPVDGEQSLGFCHTITAIDDMLAKDGKQRSFALMRVLKVSEFYGKWLPPSFKQAKLALVDRSGAFIVHFNSFEGSKLPVVENNFFEYLINQTNADESTVDDIRNKFDSILSSATPEKSFSGKLNFINKSGQEGYYSYHRLQADEDWVLVGYILRADLNIISLDTTLVSIVIIGFLILFLIDGAYIIVVNKHLKKSMEEIKFANEAKTRFLSSMSHDIRTPMNAIIGMTTIATKKIDDKQEVRECLKQITRASNHLLTLINDVLDISKVESGKFTLNPAVFSLAEVVANIINITQPHIKEKEMEFEIHARNVHHEYIYADELRINQILINLISNAIKYTPAKGKVLFKIEEKASNKGSNLACIIFTVADTGIGISEDFMKNMYETFTRDVDSRINKIQGAGLGLSITKQMVDIMDGTIDVKSKVGEGTTFTVTLDLPIAEKMTDDYILPPLRMLVVDDDEAFLESAEDTLKSLGLEVETILSALGAIQLVSDRHQNDIDYQCVIVDWKMPQMDGLETIRNIRKVVGKEVSVIIVSAYDWTDIEEEAIKAGANGFISKPLFRSSVYNKLNEILKFDDYKKDSQETAEEDLKGVKLLIAEDNDINWEIIESLLEFHGITSERAENGQVCVDKINSSPEGTYDAIIMDVQMPVMNGKEATQLIRKSENFYVRNIPIIAMTADAFAEDIKACIDAGMDGHIAKPVDMDKLLKVLREALSKKNN